MRVLHMVPDIGISNGIMSVILNYAKALHGRVTFDVVYFFETEHNRSDEIHASGGHVYKINAPSPKTVFDREIDKLFYNHKGEWDSLHIHAPHFALFIAPPAKRNGIHKIAIHCHSTWYSLYSKHKLRNKMLYLLGKPFADKKFACGEAAGVFWYGKQRDFTVLPNAVDTKKFQFNAEVRSTTRSAMKLDQKLVVGHLGRTFPPQKNHPFLLRVFAEVRKRVPDSVLLLIGAEEDDVLRNLAKELNVYKYVMFLGARTDVAELCQAMDVFVFPSFWEGLPVSVVEAQAAGLPVVMSDSITTEVAVTPDLVTMSIDENPAMWAEAAIELSKRGRRNNYELMRTSGWDIYEEANKLYEYYIGE